MLSGAYYAQNYVRRLDNGCYARYTVMEKNNKENQEDRRIVWVCGQLHRLSLSLLGPQP